MWNGFRAITSASRHDGSRQQHSTREEQRIGHVVNALQQAGLGRGEEDGHIKEQNQQSDQRAE